MVVEVPANNGHRCQWSRGTVCDPPAVGHAQEGSTGPAPALAARDALLSAGARLRLEHGLRSDRWFIITCYSFHVARFPRHTDRNGRLGRRR